MDKATIAIIVSIVVPFLISGIGWLIGYGKISAKVDMMMDKWERFEELDVVESQTQSVRNTRSGRQEQILESMKYGWIARGSTRD